MKNFFYALGILLPAILFFTPAHAEWESDTISYGKYEDRPAYNGSENNNGYLVFPRSADDIEVSEDDGPIQLTIQEIQQTPDGQAGPSPYVGEEVKFSGVVTASGNNGYFVQDGDTPWAGIYVEEFFNNATVGDNATITGTVFEFDNETRIQAPTYTVNSSGNKLPDPINITSDQMDEPYEGVLVRIENAECISHDGGEWIINDGNGNLVIGSRLVTFSPEVGTTYSITAIGSENNNGYLVFPRSADDIEVSEDDGPIHLTIQEIQQTPDGQSGPSPYVGEEVIFSGIVTASGNNGYFVQDGETPWAGIYVEEFFNSATAGDDATITGTVFEYDNETRIQAPSYTVNSSGNMLPDPINITSDQMGEPYEGVLVRIENAECVSHDGGEWIINDGNGNLVIGSRLVTFSPEVGTTYSITAIGSENNNGYLVFPRSADDIEESAMFDHDLGIKSIQGPEILYIDEEGEFEVVVKNFGIETSGDYTVDLLVNGSQTHSIAGIELEQNETFNYILNWQANEIGSYEISSKVVYPQDENPENNMSELMPVNVLDQDGSEVVTIGDQENSDFSRLPVRLDNKYSMSQQIFYQSEINTSGPIAKIGYDTNFEKDEVIYEPMQIWIKETEQNELANGWIAPDEFTLVFDGIIAYPPGQGSITIELDSTFNYSGNNNLVIMSYTEVDYEHNHFWCNFYYSIDETNLDRSRTAHSNSFFDINDPLDGETINHYTNTTLYFWTQETGTLSGQVTNNENDPLENVEVVLGENLFSTVTDANGEYFFPYAFEGDQVLKAKLFSFYDYIDTINIIQGHENVVDIIMEKLPKINVSGQLVANYGTEVAITDAEVHLNNYESYSTVSNDNGFFTFELVYGDKEYDLSVVADGFEPYTDSYYIPGSNIDLGQIIIDESPIPPGNIIAEELPGGEKLVQWSLPGEGYPEYEIAYDHNFPTNAMNWSELGGECAVRFSPYDYPAKVTGGAVNIWDGSWPDGVQLKSFDIAVYAADGLSDSPNIPHEFPGTELARITVTPDEFGWVTFDLSSQEIYIEEGDFYISFIQTTNAPEAPPLAIDGTDPVFQNYVLYPGDTYWWGYHPHYNDFMIRALVKGPGSNVRNTPEVLKPLEKTRDLEDQIVGLPAGIKFDQNYRDLPEYNFSSNSRLVEAYNLFRLEAGEEENFYEWTQLVSETTDTSFVDSQWPNLPDGTYRFAAQAIYYGGIASSFIFSEHKDKGLSTPVNIQVSTNSGLSPEGAIIELINEDGVHNHKFIVAQENDIYIDKVYKGNYTVRGWLSDYEFFIQDNVDIQDNEAIAVEFEESIFEINNLEGVANTEDIFLEWDWYGVSNVLFVDDDNSCNHNFYDTQPFYTNLFETLGVNFEIIEVTEDQGDGPDALTMQPYDMVIWETGENWLDSRTLTPNDETNLAVYLDQGGKVLLSAQHYLYDRYHEQFNFFPGEFPYEYLGVWGAIQDAIIVGPHQDAIPYATINGAEGSFVNNMTVDFENVFTHMFIDILLPRDISKPYVKIDGNAVAISTHNTIFTTAALPGIVDAEDSAMEFFKNTINGFFIPSLDSQTFKGFNIYRNGELTAENVMDFQFADEGLPNGVYEYQVLANFHTANSNILSTTLEISGSTVGVSEPETSSSNLIRCYPNPFSTSTAFEYSKTNGGHVRLEIFDIKGQTVKTLVNKNHEPGKYQVVWDGNDSNGNKVSTGIYFYKMQTNKENVFGKIIKE